MLETRNVLISGGTGSVGSEVVKSFHKEAQRIVVFSRDEYKQYMLQQELQYDKVEWVLGDIRDADALYNALFGIDIVIHCAALKQLPRGETDPLEFKKTNVDGAVNIIDACLAQGVKKCIVISTDKAVEPISSYGCSKMLADRLFLDANKYKQTMFVICRFGNVMGSRGSVINKFQMLAEKGQLLPITDMNSTRFWLDLDVAMQMIHKVVNIGRYGEIYVPRMPSFHLYTLASIFNDIHEEIGLQPGEKLDEVAILPFERNYPSEGFFVVGENVEGWVQGEYLRYASNTNDWWLTVDEMRDKIGKLSPNIVCNTLV